MKIVVITQDDPFYLPDALERFINGVASKHEITGCVLLSASPFGKRESAFNKAARTYHIFGLRFFIHYALRFFWEKLFRRNTVNRILKTRGVQITTLEKSINHSESIAKIQVMQPDVLVSILGNEIFGAPLLKLAPCLNLHTAPLPRYRGLMPTFWVLRYGEPETAVSVFLVDEGIDSGPILVQRKVPIDGKSQEQLIRETKAIGMDAMVEAIDLVARGAPALIDNDADQATYYSFPTKEDVQAFRAAGAKFY